MKIGHDKNFWGGVLFILIGLVFALIARGLKLGDSVLLAGYTMGTPARMGPGFFPFYLGLMLIGLGVLIAWTGVRKHAGDDGKIEKFHWKPILYVLGAVVGFGLLLKPIGMLLAGVLLVLGASLGSSEFNFRKILILAVILSVFCALVFVVGLKLPIPLCPDVESLQSSIGFCRS
jgi:hypothetical protein